MKFLQPRCGKIDPWLKPLHAQIEGETFSCKYLVVNNNCRIEDGEELETGVNMVLLEYERKRWMLLLEYKTKRWRKWRVKLQEEMESKGIRDGISEKQ
jgi:hypothetical protein